MDHSFHFFRSFNIHESTTRLDQIWRKFATFAKFLKVFGNFQNLHLASDMRWNLLWQIFYANGRIFIGLSGQILKNSFAIWSHCHQRFPLNVFSAIEVIIQILTNGRIWIDRAAWNGWKSVLLLLRRRWRWRRGIHLLHFRRYSSIQSCPNIKKLSPTRIHISKSFIFPHRVISYPHMLFLLL